MFYRPSNNTQEIFLRSFHKLSSLMLRTPVVKLQSELVPRFAQKPYHTSSLKDNDL